MRNQKKTICLADLVSSIFETASEESQNQQQALTLTALTLGRVLGHAKNPKALQELLSGFQEPSQKAVAA